ncbi:MAG: DM13 domain-containing protein [Roseiflexaceae bacterium]|nr:DM13 domain-containing protein [Roseiflexaceae bacterium]
MTITRTQISIMLVVAVVALAVLWLLFRPELLFVNATVNEAPPVVSASAPPAVSPANDAALQPTAAASSATPAVEQPAAPAAAAPLAEVAPTTVPAQASAWSASFQSLAHETSGTASVRVLEDGAQVLRLEDFKTSNGPDVRVYLVRGSDATQDAAINSGDFIDLGALKGNIGDQNYAISSDVDLSEYQSVSIWCRRFSVNFGGTNLDTGV